MADVTAAYKPHFEHTICVRCNAKLRSTDIRGPIPWVETWSSVPTAFNYSRFHCDGDRIGGQLHDPMPDLQDPKEVAAWLKI